jgi:hypothetical protein
MFLVKLLQNWKEIQMSNEIFTFAHNRIFQICSKHYSPRFLSNFGSIKIAHTIDSRIGRNDFFFIDNTREDFQILVHVYTKNN